MEQTKKVQGSLTAEFFDKVGRWNHLSPSKAEATYEAMLSEAQVPVYFEQRLDREKGVVLKNNRIIEIRMKNGSSFKGKMFIDATYEGDLMAAAGVSYTSGRDPKDLYDEKGAGIDEGRNQRISPYVVPDDPSSGVIPYVIDKMPEDWQGPDGSDGLLQAYNFRMHLTKGNHKVPYPEHDGYDPADFEFMYRILAGGSRVRLSLGADTNNHEVIGHNAGTDYVNGNWVVRDGKIVNWAEATYEEREQMFQAHVKYQQGYMYYIANDLLPRAETDPEMKGDDKKEWAMEQVRKLVTRVNEYGLDPDHFGDTGHWPWALYIREARRMVSDEVMTEHNVFARDVAEDSVGLANYWADSHRVRRYTKDNQVYLEGGLDMPRDNPAWPISYRSIIPAKGEVENLLVPWAISSSKVAFCSMRMEPCFMVLSQSAATAACLAIDKKTTLQELKYALLREQLLKDGQILKAPEAN